MTIVFYNCSFMEYISKGYLFMYKIELFLYLLSIRTKAGDSGDGRG